MRWAQHRFTVMATEATVLVRGRDPEVLARRAEALVRSSEQRWSRFTDTSELATLNRARGRAVPLPADTIALVALAVEAWRVTGGLFDPSVLAAVRAAGYTRSFEHGAAPAVGPVAVPGCAGVRVDRQQGTVSTPVELDLGGIGKGRAADVVAEALLDAGATGVLVDLGGDVRVGGTAPTDDGWVVGIEDPWAHGSGREIARVTVAAGAVATSSRLRRAWAGGHHLIDPRIGRPAAGPLVQVTVLAATCAWAEVFAKAVLVAGVEEGTALLERHGLAGILVDDDARVHHVGTSAFAAVG